MILMNIAMDEPAVIENDKLKIKSIYMQIREGCQRDICYNVYCHNNLISKLSKSNNTILFFLRI